MGAETLIGSAQPQCSASQNYAPIWSRKHKFYPFNRTCKYGTNSAKCKWDCFIIMNWCVVRFRCELTSDDILTQPVLSNSRCIHPISWPQEIRSKTWVQKIGLLVGKYGKCHQPRHWMTKSNWINYDLYLGLFFGKGLVFVSCVHARGLMQLFNSNLSHSPKSNKNFAVI